MTDSPAISVVLPVYNGGAFLGKAIESILNQSFRNFEFIIINDGSKDGSKKLIDHYANMDNRIVAVHQENAGLITTLNRGISLAKAPLIARMDADDISLPNRFADQYAYLQEHPEIVVLGTSIRLIDEQDQPIRDIFYLSNVKDISDEILRACPIAHPTVMARKSVLVEEGGYNPLYKHAEDYELWLRLSEKYQLVNLPGVYLLYRQHPDKISFVHSRDQTLRTFIAQLASKARREGKPDPVAHLNDITADTFNLFDLSSKEKSQYLFRTMEYSLNAHIFTKDEQPVLEIIHQAKTMAKEGNQRHFLGLVLLKSALFYVVNRNYIQAMNLIMQALWYNPSAVFETAFRIGKKLVKRLLKKVVSR